MQREGNVNSVIKIYRDQDDDCSEISPVTAEPDNIRDRVPGRNILSCS